MDFEIDDFTKEQLELAEKFFAQKCEFVLGVAKLEQLPESELTEIAFAGRSNVGKSSLINAVTAQNGLAKTSNTPGRTQQLNYFNLNDKLHIVDLPGYGFAKAPENMVKQWHDMIFTYLQGRVNLKRVFLLIDSRHGIKASDQDVMKMLDKAAVTYQIVLTKIDKISSQSLDKIKSSIENELKNHAAAYVKVLATSSDKKIGVNQVRAEIASLIKG